MLYPNHFILTFKIISLLFSFRTFALIRRRPVRVEKVMSSERCPNVAEKEGLGILDQWLLKGFGGITNVTNIKKSTVPQISSTQDCLLTSLPTLTSSQLLKWHFSMSSPLCSNQMLSSPKQQVSFLKAEKVSRRTSVRDMKRLILSHIKVHFQAIPLMHFLCKATWPEGNDVILSLHNTLLCLLR